jgi:glycosyltransferase involved in cell wall biosynthesis
MNVLVVTNMYPNPDGPAFGVFVRDQVRSLRRIGVDVDVLFMNGRRSKLNYLRAFPELWSRLRRERYDLIHAHYVFSGVVARAQRACPVVLTHHGPEVFMTWEASLSRQTKRWFDAMIVVSEEMRQRLDVPAAHVIPCGIDMQRFHPADRDEARRRLRLPGDRKLVLWAGEQWRPEKRYALVGQAMAQIRARRSDVDLVLLSGKPHDEVPAYMNACDALVLTSDAEGSPMVVKEAMACNLPVVATPAGDVREVIGRTEGCYLCSQEPGDIATKLEQALDFGGRTNGRAAVSNMEIDVISGRILDVYKKTIAAAGRHEPARGAAL